MNCSMRIYILQYWLLDLTKNTYYNVSVKIYYYYNLNNRRFHVHLRTLPC